MVMANYCQGLQCPLPTDSWVNRIELQPGVDLEHLTERELDMKDYYLEEVKERDLPEVLKIYNYYVLNTTATFHVHSLSIEEFKEMVILENSRYKTFSAKKDNSICGYATLTQHKKREAYDDTCEISIYVKPEDKGKGIGSVCLDFMEKNAKEHSFHVILATICSENHTSMNFFKRRGYIKCAHFKQVGKKFGKIYDVVVYQKIIT